MKKEYHRKKQSPLLIILLSLLIMISSLPGIIGSNHFHPVGIESSSLLSSTNTPEIIALSTYSATPGETIYISGLNFGTNPGYIVLSGLRITAETWSETEITLIIPDFGATGTLYIRDATDASSNQVSFSVERELLDHQFTPYGFTLEETGLFGPASLVETDGDYLYGITGFETLCTYRINTNEPNDLLSIVSLPQRVGDLKIHDNYLFCAGDHGLFIFSTNDLQQGNTDPMISIAGASFLTLDVKEKDGEPIHGTLLALCEYLPKENTNQLRIPLFQIESEELIYLGSYTRSVRHTERHHAIAIDPLNPKVYVSGYETLLGEDKYLLEIDITNPSTPLLNYREETDGVLGFDLETKNDILWMGVSSTGTEHFRTYDLHAGTEHLSLGTLVEGIFGLGRTTRVKIIDEKTTVGVAWSGARPDIFLLDTFNSGTTPLATADSLDWAFDVTGYSTESNESSGKILVADEWGGFLSYDYQQNPSPSISHQQDYDWTPSSAMTENLYLTDERIYAANRGAGIWSADKDQVSDYSDWRHSEWDWTLEDPQPYPISALCVHDDPTYGTLIAARGNNKAMAWGDLTYGILCKETAHSIQTLAISEEINPDGGLLSGGPGLSVIWPETDLVYMATGTDGFRAFIVDPTEPSITIHQDCQTTGFCPHLFGTNRTVSDMMYFKTGDEQKIITASGLSLFVNEPSILVFDVTYPQGVPDRNNPDRDIIISLEDSLQCLKGKAISYADMSPNGFIAVATSLGAAVFHVSWVPSLNELNHAQAWNQIKIPIESYDPWWDASFSANIADVSFGDDSTLYVVKKPQGDIPGGIWCLQLNINEEALTHTSYATGYYPGVQCGLDYNMLLQGWGNPDITTIHHPYGLVADENTVYVTGWSGKIDRLTISNENQAPTDPVIQGPSNGKAGTSYFYSFSSTDPEGDTVFYYIDWGDNQMKEWIGPYNSGEVITMDHQWSNQGRFTVKARARDDSNAISDWSELEISMPNIRIDLFSQFLRFLLRIIG